MKITAEGRTTGRFTFYNVHLASGEGKDPFLTIKGVRVIEGSKGRFVSWPSRKDDAGKYWPHLYATDAFQAAVILAIESAEPVDNRTHGERKRGSQNEAPF